MPSKLSKHQKERIKNQQSDKLLKNSKQGRVISHLGYQVVVQIDDELHSVDWRKQIKDISVNDLVALTKENNQWVIEAIFPRKNALCKWQSRKLKAIASNVDQLLIMVSVEPDWQNALIDRYLIAAGQVGIKVAIFCNKIDLIKADAQKTLMKRLAIYEQLGHRVFYGSCHDKSSLGELMQWLDGKDTVMCGQSGVGKSSLIRALIANVDIWIQSISLATGLGKHTTTNARLYEYDTRTTVIDTPGIRGFAITHFNDDDVKLAFPEIMDYASKCYFNDCKHINEPKCAVLEAVDNSLISKDRYESMMQMLESNK